MNITQFNEDWNKRNKRNKSFRFVEIEPYVRHNNKHVRRFNLQQYCPKIDKYCRMLLPGHWGHNIVSDDETPIIDEKCFIRDSLLRDLAKPTKYIIICKEKHGTNYFDASTTEVIGCTAIHILKSRAEQGYYYELEPVDKEDPPKPTQKEEDFPNDPVFAKLAREEWGKYNRDIQRQLNDKDFRVRFDKAPNDYREALHLLIKRNDYQYEGFRLEVLESIS